MSSRLLNARNECAEDSRTVTRTPFSPTVSVQSEGLGSNRSPQGVVRPMNFRTLSQVIQREPPSLSGRPVRHGGKHDASQH